MHQSLPRAVAVQGRVLWALSLREIHGRHGRYKIGYLWQLIRVAFGVAVFWWIREINYFHAPQGLATPVFLLMGFGPWYIFSESIDKVMEAVRTNKGLLTFPQITPLDLCVSGSSVIAATQVVVMVIFLAVVALAGYEVRIHNPFVFVAGLCGVALLGLGLGLALMALSFYLPILENFVPMVLRIMFFITGVFFSPSQMTGIYGDVLMWIPTANYIEMLRGAFVGVGIHETVKVNYTIFITAALLALGLLLERHVRPQQEVS